MSEPAILCSSISPNGNLEAIVEQDDRTVYFYLHGAPETDFPMKSCWVQNLVAAPEKLDRNAMRQGHPPLLPRGACKHPQGA